MKLIIMRHGEAEPRAASDEVRPLTDYGRNQVVKVGQSLATRMTHLDRVIASPYLRAQQTVEIVERSYSLDHETSSHLTPDSSPQQVLQLLAENAVDTVLVVSHQPLVSLLIEHLTGERISMGTANIVLVELEILDSMQGEVKWVM